MRIVNIRGRQILDSRGRPTVEADVTLEDGAFGRASVPSGASTGGSEAHEMRDGDELAYFGRGVTKAVDHVNGVLASALAGFDAMDQAGVDRRILEVDGTHNLSNLGANAALGISLAVCRATAVAQHQPLFRRIAELSGVSAPSLPLPMVNILSGGLHAGRGMDVQDFLAVPLSAPDYATALHDIVRVREAAIDVVRSSGAPTLLADEGGLSPGCATTEEAFDLLMTAITAAGFAPGRDIGIAIDMAATSLLDDEEGYLFARQGVRHTSEEMIEVIACWAKRYPLISVEDGLHDEDWEYWTKLTDRLKSIQILGDDLFATDRERITKGVGLRAANAALIKVNQNGTLSGTLSAMQCARDNGYATIVSARSGETADTFMADLAVGTAAGQIKIGSVKNSERLEKYNQLLRISEDPTIGYSGTRFLAPLEQVASSCVIATGQS